MKKMSAMTAMLAIAALFGAASAHAEDKPMDGKMAMEGKMMMDGKAMDARADGMKGGAAAMHGKKTGTHCGAGKMKADPSCGTGKK